MKPPVFNYADYEQLQQRYTKAMELLGLAVEDMNYLANCTEEVTVCPKCFHFGKRPVGSCCFKWQHADKLEELRGGNSNGN